MAPKLPGAPIPSLPGAPIPKLPGFNPLPRIGSGGGITFIPNPAGMKALGATPSMMAALRARAEDAAEIARDIAPVRTGDYRDSIESDAEIENGTAVARLQAGDFKASWIEFGTSIPWAGHGTLRKAIEAAGLKLVGGRRG